MTAPKSMQELARDWTLYDERKRGCRPRWNYQTMTRDGECAWPDCACPRVKPGPFAFKSTNTGQEQG